MVEIQEENDRRGGNDPVEHLHRAEHDLEQALEKSREAACDVVKAEAEVEKAIDEIEHPRQFKVKVLCTASTRPSRFAPRRPSSSCSTRRSARSARPTRTRSRSTRTERSCSTGRP